VPRAVCLAAQIKESLVHCVCAAKEHIVPLCQERVFWIMQPRDAAIGQFVSLAVADPAGDSALI